MTITQQMIDLKWHVDRYTSEDGQAKYAEEYFQNLGLLALRFGKAVAELTLYQ